jgi:hypothetical protein
LAHNVIRIIPDLRENPLLVRHLFIYLFISHHWQVIYSFILHACIYFLSNAYMCLLIYFAHNVIRLNPDQTPRTENPLLANCFNFFNFLAHKVIPVIPRPVRNPTAGKCFSFFLKKKSVKNINWPSVELIRPSVQLIARAVCSDLSFKTKPGKTLTNLPKKNLLFKHTLSGLGFCSGYIVAG